MLGSEVIHNLHRPRSVIASCGMLLCFEFGDFLVQTDALGGAQIGLAAASARFTKVRHLVHWQDYSL